MRMKRVGRGFGLIEVMVALGVISIGALGYAKSQMASLKSISDTMTRTIATTLLQDMAGRMQANAAELWKGAGSASPLVSPSAYLSASPVINNSCYGSNNAATLTGCTSDQMALNDVAEWQQMISNLFPVATSAMGLICLEATPGTASLASPSCGVAVSGYPMVFTLKIYWKSTQSGGAYDQVVVATVQAPLLRAPIYPLAGPAPNT